MWDIKIIQLLGFGGGLFPEQFEDLVDRPRLGVTPVVCTRPEAHPDRVTGRTMDARDTRGFVLDWNAAA